MIIAKSQRIERYHTIVAAKEEPSAGRFIKCSGFVIGYLFVQCAQRREYSTSMSRLLHVGKPVVGACPHAAFTVCGHTVYIV